MPLLKNKTNKVHNFKFAFWLSIIPIILTSIIIDRINYNRQKDAHRLHIFSEISTYRAQLESILVSNIQLIRGLAIAVAAEPNLKQDRFSQIAAPLFETSDELRSVNGAPNMVIQMSYPLQGAEKILGLNFLDSKHNRLDAIRAKKSNSIVMAGPLSLIQGDSALIARVPVHTAPNKQFWGLLSIVLDVEKIYQNARIHELETHYTVAIQGQNGLGKQGKFFYGDKNILRNTPLEFPLIFPGGKWQLYVVPKAGWDPSPSTIWPFRLAIIIICGLLILAFFFFIKMLNRQQKNEEMLETMSDLAQIGAWSFNLESKHVYWSDVTKKIFKCPLNVEPKWPTDLSYFKEGHSRSKIKFLIERAIKLGESYEVELEVLNSQNQTIWVLINGETEHKNGRCIRVFGSLQNIDTRKKIEIENTKTALHNEILASLTVNKLILNGQLSQSKDIITQSICQAFNINRASILFFNNDKSLLTSY